MGKRRGSVIVLWWWRRWWSLRNQTEFGSVANPTSLFTSEGSIHNLSFHLLQPGISSRNMTTHYPRQELTSKAMNGAEKKLNRVNISLQESIAHLHPLQRQHAIELHRQQQQQPPPPPPPTRPQVQASLSTFTACTVPASCRARSRFLNLRDSVKKSPTKSTAKVVSSIHAASRPEIPWVPFSFSKVLQDRLQVLFADLLCCSVSVRGRIVTVFVEPSPNQKVLLALSWLEVKSCTQSNLFFSDFSV